MGFVGQSGGLCTAILTEDNLTMKHTFEKLGLTVAPLENEKLLAAIMEL